MSNVTGYVTDGAFDRLDVAKISVNKDETNPTTGIIDTNKLNVTSEIESDTIYCKKLVVRETLSIPVENMPDLNKETILIDTVNGPKTISVNADMGKISYDGILKDLKATTNSGDKRSVTDTHVSVTNNSRFKENIMLYGWSAGDKSDTALHQSNYKDIDLDEHVYYQGCGYIIGFNNPSATQTTETINTVQVPESIETRIVPETTQTVVTPEQTITTVIPESTTQNTATQNKYYNDVSNPYRQVDEGILSEVPDSGTADQIAFDSHNNLYKTQWQTKTLSVIKTTGEKIELVTFSEYVYSLVIDKNDTLWINTTSGYNRIYKIQLDNGTITSNELHFDYSELISQDFRNLALNSKDELFVITALNGYIYKLSKIDSNFTQYFGPVSDNDPRAMCFDKYDNILYGGRIGKKIYKVTDNNGSPTQSFYGNIVTSIGTIFGLTVDDNNDVFASVQSLNKIKKITSDGLMTDIAGTGSSSGSIHHEGDPMGSSVKTPGGLLFDKYGDLYIGLAIYPSNDTNHILSLGFSYKAWEDSPIVNTMIKTPKSYELNSDFIVNKGESRLFRSTGVSLILGIVVDSDGYIYAGSSPANTPLIKISPNGETQENFGPTASVACLAIDSNNNIYSAGGNSGGIKKIDPNGNSTDILTGGNIFGIGVDSINEYLYYVESMEDKVYRLDLLDYTKKEVICDMRTTGSLNLPGRPQDASVISYDMHLTSNNVLIIASSRGYIYKIDINNGSELEFLAGNGGAYDGGYGTGSGYNMGNGENFKLDQIWGIASDDNNDIYVGSWSHKVIGKLTLDGIGSLIAGTPGNGTANYNTSISNTTLVTPRALFFKKETGNLYFVDQNGTIAIMAIRPEANVDSIVTKIYDNPRMSLFNGAIDNYILNHPSYDFIVDENDVRYFTCKNENKIYRVLSDKTMEVFYTETDNLFILQYLAIDSNGNIYVSGMDKGIKKIDPDGNATQLTPENSYGEIRGIVIKNDIVHFLSDDKKIYKMMQIGQTVDYNVTANDGKFYLNGIEKPILNLTIGMTYRFIIDSSILANHPFYLTTANVAWAAAVNSIHSGDEVTTNSDNSIITFIPTQERTDFHYQCGNHEGMGNQIIVRNNNNLTPVEVANINDAGVVSGYDTNGIAVDSNGNIYVAENVAGQIFKINNNNVISVFAGVNSTYGVNDAGLQDSTFSGIKGMVFDKGDNLYIVSNNRAVIRKISKNGEVSTIGGLVDTEGNNNGEFGTLSQPNGIAVDQYGDIYITELNGHIRVLGTDVEVSLNLVPPFKNDPNFTIPLNEVSTRIESGAPMSTGLCFVIDSNNNYFICCQTPNSIKKITPDGQSEVFWTGSDNYPAHAAIDKDNNIFVSLKGGAEPHKITKITPDGIESDYWLSTVAGDSPGPLVIDSNNRLICIINNVIDPLKNSRICLIENNELTTIMDISSNLQNKIANNFNISCLTINSKDELFMCELMNDYESSFNGARILKYSYIDGLTIFTNDTSSENNNYQQGMPIFSRFNHPSSITIDKHDNLYLVEEMMHLLVKITPDKRVKTIAGQETPGNENGVFSIAKLNRPVDIKIDNHGVINILDKNSGHIRSVNLGLRDKLVKDVLTSYLRTSLPLQQIHDFPDIMNHSDWILTLQFNYGDIGNTSKRIIGGPNDQLNNTEWTLLLNGPGSLGRSFYWKILGGVREIKLYSFPNVNYKFSITKTPNGSSFSYVFVLENLDDNTSSTVTFDTFSPSVIPTTHPVYLGGSWMGENSTSRFTGNITEITYQSSSYNGTYILKPTTIYSAETLFNTPAQIIKETIQQIIPEQTVTTVIPESTEIIVIPESTVDVVIPAYTTTVVTTTEVFRPIAFMSRLDYFVVTIDSFSNTTSFPVNFLDISLYNSIDTDLRINVVRKDTKFKLEVKVNSNQEVKWFGLINLKKIYLKHALNRLTDDTLKYDTSDNLFNWEPVVSSISFNDNCFKFVEGLELKKISPFADNVVTEQTTYSNSVIDDTLLISPKVVSERFENDPQSIREIIGNTFLDRISSSFNYNTYGYHSTFLIQPTFNNIKKLTTSYAHSSYFLNNNGNSEVVTFENEFGNSFTKVSTKDSSAFSTSQIKESSNEYYWDKELTTQIKNKKINFIFQLKEKEQKYQPTLGILYYRMFSTKAFNDTDDSPSHRDFVFEHNNYFDIAENIQINLQLYKNISTFNANVPKQIFLTQKNDGNNELRYFDLGVHHFIKSYITVRDITNNKNVFFTHYSSIILPTYSVMRQFFTEKREEGVTDLNVMKTKFIEKYINSNTIINELDTNSYEESESYEYTMTSPYKYVNNNGKKFIDESTDDINLIKYNISVETEPVFEQIIVDNLLTNSIEVYNSIQTAYNTFDVKFPIKVMCTSSNTSKFQVNVLLEINKFTLDTY